MRKLAATMSLTALSALVVWGGSLAHADALGSSASCPPNEPISVGIDSAAPDAVGNDPTRIRFSAHIDTGALPPFTLSFSWVDESGRVFFTYSHYFPDLNAWQRDSLG